VRNGIIEIDPLTRNTISKNTFNNNNNNNNNNTFASPYHQQQNRIRTNSLSQVLNHSVNELFEGPVLVIESEHPYKHNINEYTTVQVPGAVRF
jgi:hypothetical protein